MYLNVMKKIWRKCRVYLNSKNKSHSIFSFYYMLELERNAYCVAFQKDPEKG